MDTQDVNAIEVEAESKLDTSVNQNFYIVSKNKFLTLFICTLGLYIMYWFFKNWQLHKKVTGESIWPIPRGIFLIFFVHDLFRRIDRKLTTNRQQYQWQPDSLATSVVVLCILSNILSRLGDKNIAMPFTDIGSLVALLIAGFLLLKAQDAINLACNDPDGSTNGRFTWANILWILVGSIFIILIAIGLLIPVADPA